MLVATAAFYAVVSMMGPLADAPRAPIDRGASSGGLRFAANTTATTASPSPAAPGSSPPPSTAPSAPMTPPNDAALDAVVDTLQKTYEGTKDFKGRFTQKFTYTMLRRTQESTGSVTFEKPGRMRWDYDTPAPKSFIVDGKALWIVQPQDKVAFVNACFQQDGLTASVAFLWGDGKLREQFTISWFDGVFGDKTDHHLLLLPRDGNSVFARLILVVDPKTSRVKQSVVVDLAGNVNQFIFRDLAFNVGKAGGITAATFRYVPATGIHAQRLPGSCDAAVAGLPSKDAAPSR
jgi:outer membrane lipoprotein carrier protein